MGWKLIGKISISVSQKSISAAIFFDVKSRDHHRETFTFTLLRNTTVLAVEHVRRSNVTRVSRPDFPRSRIQPGPIIFS